MYMCNGKARPRAVLEAVRLRDVVEDPDDDAVAVPGPAPAAELGDPSPRSNSWDSR